MEIDCKLELHFGRDGNSSAFQVYGWSPPENGYTFCIGDESALTLPCEANETSRYLEISLRAFLCPPVIVAQRISVRINGRSVGAAVITEWTTLGFLIPDDVLGNILELIIEHPDARRPSDVNESSDNRSLSVAIHSIRVYAWKRERIPCARKSRLTFSIRNRSNLQAALAEVGDRLDVDSADLVRNFESLGENCELGLFQRLCGEEPLGLLRFSTVPLHTLLQGLRNSFLGLGEPEYIDPRVEDKEREWMIRERRYLLRYHTFVRETDATREEILEREKKKLTFLKRKFLEELALGEKIFVYKRINPLLFEEIIPLFVALRQHGQNSLLWIVQAKLPYEPGTVEELLPGLFRGHIDRLAMINTPIRQSSVGWLEICAAAWEIRKNRLVVDPVISTDVTSHIGAKNPAPSP